MTVVYDIGLVVGGALIGYGLGLWRTVTILRRSFKGDKP